MVAVLWRCRCGRLFLGGGGGAVWPHGCSGRRRARPPARLGVLTSFGAAPRSPPVPSGPSGALDTSGAGLLCVPMGGGPPASQAARLSETGVAFAGAGRAATETAVAFAGAGRAATETVVAFAGVKWAFLVQFSGAEVMPVSEVPCWGRAVVLLVSTSPRCRASCAKNFALLGLMCARARKSSPCALTMAQNWRFLACWASFFAEEPLEGRCWASFFAPTDLVPVLDAAPCTSGWLPMGDLQH